MKRLTAYICERAHGAEGVSESRLTGAYCRGQFEATALVERLAKIEDILGDDYDLDRLWVIVEADRRKRERADAKCGSCAHFHYIGKTKSGKCGMRGGFTTFQSHLACKMFISRDVLAKEETNT